MNSLSKQAAAVLAVGLGIAAMAGCRSTGPERLAATSASIQETRNALARASAQIDATLPWLNAMVNQPGTDLRTALARFVREIPRNQAQADRITLRSERMRARSTEYFGTWAQEIARMHNEDVRAVSDTRRATAMESFNRATDQMNATRESYVAFMSRLLDIQNHLGNDLTRDGAQAAVPLVTRANNDGETVKQNIASVIAELDRLVAALSPQ